MSVPDTTLTPSPVLAAPLAQPTRYRYGVLAFACVLSMVTYLDRVCFGTVGIFIQQEFGLTPEQMGYLFGAFTLAYAVFEVPSGWLGDVFGPRKTLIRIVLWWSLFTALTGAIYPNGYMLNLGGMMVSASFLLLLGVRFLFGVGEAGAYPNIARAFHNWFPFQERGSAKGTVWMAGRFAGGISPFIVLLLVHETVVDGQPVTYWRHTFWIFGGLGVLWCLLFWWWFRDRPEQKAGVNAAELALIRGDTEHDHAKVRVPWGQLLVNRNLWYLCGQYFCASYGWYFNITFLPKFLKEIYGLNQGEKWSAEWWSFAFMAGLPLLFGSMACLIGGLLTDKFIQRTGNRKWGRRLFGMLGHGLCAVCIFLAFVVFRFTPSEGNLLLFAWLFALANAAASFCNDMTMGSAWASCLDIGGKYSGIVAGCMNTIGNLGGFCANILTGTLLGLFTHKLTQGTPAYEEAMRSGWTLNFLIFSAVYALAVVCWSRFDATKPVVPERRVA